MEQDPIFIMTNSTEEITKELKRFGLTEGDPNIHPGQGIACRRFFFKNAYLEITWITDEEEVKSTLMAETKLWERSISTLSQYENIIFEDQTNRVAFWQALADSAKIK